jgi:hypothetical protein
MGTHFFAAYPPGSARATMIGAFTFRAAAIAAASSGRSSSAPLSVSVKVCAT